MKKATFLVLILFFATQLPLISQALDETEFVGAKAQMLFAYSALESDALKLSLLYEKAQKMSIKEQVAILMARGDLELGMFIVKDVLGLYTLQGVQVSTPPEAQQLLIDASLDANEFLDGLLQRIKSRMNDITNQEATNILTNSYSLLNASIKAINVLKKAITNL